MLIYKKKTILQGSIFVVFMYMPVKIFQACKKISKGKSSKRGSEFEMALVIGSISKSLLRTFPFPALLSNNRKREKIYVLYIYLLNTFLYQYTSLRIR